MNNRVTVIMPVYNGEAYLERSIGRIYEEDYPDIELITVNDGSADHSPELLRRMKSHAPSHITHLIIDQENQGISAARNAGLDAATGEYIMFVDQDDRLKKGCIRVLHAIARREDSDMVIGGCDMVDRAGHILEKWTLDPDFPYCKYRITAPWGRLYRRSVLEKNSIRFMPAKISEDFYFNLVCMSYCNRITVTPYRGYGWYLHDSSESHKNMSRMSDDRNPLEVLGMTLRDMNPGTSLEQECYEYMIIKHVYWYMLYTAKSSDSAQIRASYDACIRWLREHIPDYRSNRLICDMNEPKGEGKRQKAIVKLSALLERMHLLYPALTVYSKL